MITPTQARKAAKLEISLVENGGGIVTATHPKTNTKLICTGPADAFKQVAAAVMLKTNYMVTLDDSGTMVHCRNRAGQVLTDAPHKPVAALKLAESPDSWVSETTEMLVAQVEPDVVNGEDTMNEALVSEIERGPNGAALDGTVAYTEGTPAADNPFMIEGEEETDESHASAEKWDADWDAAADKAEADKPVKGGSVVHDRYRVRYAEAGHPTHCGDWLAETLNNLVLNKTGTNLELFEAICTANNVDLSAYRREGKGWEGRFRMTGRNLMAKKVYLAGGVLTMPDGTTYKAPGDWMESQRYKMPKAEQAKPIPTV